MRDPSGETPRVHPRHAVFLVLGWVLVSLAIALLVRADMGVAPYDVLNTALSARTGFSVGASTWISAAGLLAIAWILGSPPGPATFLGSFFIGACIDAALTLIPTALPAPTRLGFVFVAFSLLYPGVCLIVLSRLGAGPTEVLMVALTRRGISVARSRWVVEAACVAGGGALGGELGLVTIVVVFAAGPLISRLLPLIARLTKLEPL